MMLLLLLLLLLLADLTTSFATTTSRLKRKTTQQPTRLILHSFSSDDEQDDWLAEMNSKTFDALQENKEPLFDHDDWVKYRSPERRMNDAFDIAFPFLAAFVVFLLEVAIAL